MSITYKSRTNYKKIQIKIDKSNESSLNSSDFI